MNLDKNTVYLFNLLLCSFALLSLGIIFRRTPRGVPRRARDLAGDVVTLLRNGFSKRLAAPETWPLFDRRRVQAAFLLVWATFALQFGLRVGQDIIGWSTRMGFLIECANHLNNLAIVLFAVALPQPSRAAEETPASGSWWFYGLATYAVLGIAGSSRLFFGGTTVEVAGFVGILSATAMLFLGWRMLRHLKLYDTDMRLRVFVFVFFAGYAAVNLYAWLPQQDQSDWERAAMGIALLMKVGLLLGGIQVLHAEAGRGLWEITQRDALELQQLRLNIESNLASLTRQAGDLAAEAGDAEIRPRVDMLRSAINQVLMDAISARHLTEERLRARHLGGAQPDRGIASAGALVERGLEASFRERRIPIQVAYEPPYAGEVLVSELAGIAMESLLMEAHALDPPPRQIDVRVRMKEPHIVTLGIVAHTNATQGQAMTSAARLRCAASDLSRIQAKGLHPLTREAAQAVFPLGGHIDIQGDAGIVCFVAEVPVDAGR